MATLNPVLRSFWEQPCRNRVLYGGRMSSKSWDAAGVAVCIAQSCKVRILCTRQFQNKISESVYTLLKKQIERFGLEDEFEIQANSIKHRVTGSEFLFYGLWRHIDEIKSLEDIDICWIEEAHNLTPTQWEILEPTVRKESSQFWIIFNPRFATDFVYKRFVVNPPPNTLIRKINYTENAYLSDTALAVIQAMKDEDYEEYQHVYLGVPRDSDDRVIIKRSWIMAAIDAHKTVKPSHGIWTGLKTTGYDVGDGGDDPNATTSMDGRICTILDEWPGNTDELFESAQRAHHTAKLNESSMIGYDSIGVGSGTGSHLNNDGWPKAQTYRFNAGGKVHNPDKKYKDSKLYNKDFFSNLKAQAWWLEGDRFRNTFLAVTKGRSFRADEMISISSLCNAKYTNQLIDELSTPLRDFDLAGKVKVESKKDLKKRDVDSPNIADSFIIADARGLMARRSLRETL